MVAGNALLVRALCGSALLHCAVAAWLPGGGAATPARAPSGPPVLQAVLAPEPTAAVEWPVFTILGPSPVAATPPLALAELTLSPLPAARAEPQEQSPWSAPDASGAGGAPGASLVEGELLADRIRIGTMLGREVSEFPVEIGTPVRPVDTIAVPYPAAALREGREADVVVWVVVDPQGTVEEVQVTEGPAEFADAVVPVVSAARFVPATDNRKPIRFPIALQFHFGASSPAATRTAAVAAAGTP